MGWLFTDQIETYADRVLPLLAAHPEEHTVALTLIEGLRRGERWSDEPMHFGWYEAGDGSVRGAARITPPYHLLLAVVPEGTEPALVDALRGRSACIPGLNGGLDVAQRVGAA